MGDAECQVLAFTKPRALWIESVVGGGGGGGGGCLNVNSVIGFGLDLDLGTSA